MFISILSNVLGTTTSTKSTPNSHSILNKLVPYFLSTLLSFFAVFFAIILLSNLSSSTIPSILASMLTSYCASVQFNFFCLFDFDLAVVKSHLYFSLTTKAPVLSFTLMIILSSVLSSSSLVRVYASTTFTSFLETKF